MFGGRLPRPPGGPTLSILRSPRTGRIHLSHLQLGLASPPPMHAVLLHPGLPTRRGRRRRSAPSTVGAEGSGPSSAARVPGRWEVPWLLPQSVAGVLLPLAVFLRRLRRFLRLLPFCWVLEGWISHRRLWLPALLGDAEVPSIRRCRNRRARSGLALLLVQTVLGVLGRPVLLYCLCRDTFGFL